MSPWIRLLSQVAIERGYLLAMVESRDLTCQAHYQSRIVSRSPPRARLTHFPVWVLSLVEQSSRFGRRPLSSYKSITLIPCPRSHHIYVSWTVWTMTLHLIWDSRTLALERSIKLTGTRRYFRGARIIMEKARRGNIALPSVRTTIDLYTGILLSRMDTATPIHSGLICLMLLWATRTMVAP